MDALSLTPHVAIGRGEWTMGRWKSSGVDGNLLDQCWVYVKCGLLFFKTLAFGQAQGTPNTGFHRTARHRDDNGTEIIGPTKRRVEWTVASSEEWQTASKSTPA